MVRVGLSIGSGAGLVGQGGAFILCAIITTPLHLGGRTFTQKDNSAYQYHRSIKHTLSVSC
jgi:hypothetical protein